MTVNTWVAILASGGLGLALAACATGNTARQNLGYERWALCNAPFVQLERIDTDGRITFLFSDSSAGQAVLQCLADAGRGGTPLPEPVGVRPSGGP
jgi:hypothetical protein